MARLLAIDWDQQTARFVVAQTRGAQLTVEGAGSVELSSESEGTTSRLVLGEVLKSTLAPYKITRAGALVAIDRGQVELVSLSLPPAADIELPEMVRNLAMRENSAIGEDSSLDFITLGDDVEQPRQVTAVSLSRERLEQIQAVAAELGVIPQIVGLRPCAAGLLAAQTLGKDHATTLVINILGEAVDLTVVAGGQAAFWRSTRQANVSLDAAAASRLIPEITRTLVVAQNQLGGQAIEAVCLFGTAEEHTALIDVLAQELALPLTVLDPFASTEAACELPVARGAWAALIGLLSTEAARGRQPIDFLHPRQRPAPPDRRRLLTLGGIAAGLVLLLGGYSVWSTFATIDAENAVLAEELADLDSRFKRAGKEQKVIAAIRDWNANDVNWLDELRDLSLRFPGSRDTVVLRMGMSHGRAGGGNVDLVGVVRDPAIVSRMENNLRDKYHQISSRHVQERVQEQNYSWQFDSSLVVLPRDKKQYVSHLPPEARPLPTADPERVGPPQIPPTRSASQR